MATLAVVPARGGSTELRRKNLLPDANGVPLFIASAIAAEVAGCRVVVSTDDPEIGAMARAEGYQVHPRGPELAYVQVDEVVAAVCNDLDWDGPVLLVQPTVQPMTADLLNWFLDGVTNHLNTPLALGVQDRHLMWHHGDVLTDRLDRQSDTDWPVREVGVRWWPRAPLSSPTRVIAAPRPLVDVDTADDYRSLDRRLRIQFAVKASDELGWGHLHRCLTLAEGLQHHHVAIQLMHGSSLDAEQFLMRRGWPAVVDQPDVVVHDMLDDRAIVWKESATVNFETTMRGGTVTINAMYGHGDYTGARYAVLRPEFTVGAEYETRVDGQRVMVMFGGTDPGDLTAKVTAALVHDYAIARIANVDVIRPEDNRNIAGAMRLADVLVTSGGRTVFEAAAVGVPTIVMAQNQRELSHTHLGVGNVSLGLGALVHPDHFRHVVTTLLADPTARRDLSATARSSIDYRGADRVRAIIEHVGLFGEKP